MMNDERVKVLKAEVEACLTENILPFWLTRMRDEERGGWYGQMTGDGRLVSEAPRGLILYARLLRTLSAAYRGCRGEALLAAATMTKDYILAHFLDREHGGLYWSVTADGRPLDTKKQFYAQAFALYGFAEYARATADSTDATLRVASAEALDFAWQLFELIESRAWDAEHGGYIEALTRDWLPIADMRLSAKDENYPKSQNTHLHIMEAYTNLLKACKSKPALLEAALRRLVTLFTDRILNPATFHLDQFFAMDWTRMSTAVSYGHDIECSWLLHEAALTLGDGELLKAVEPLVRRVAVASEEGLQPDGSMAYEDADSDRHWWVQAEAVVGFLNLYQHFGDEAALAKALGVWEYIKTRLVDYETGEWFWSIRADGTVNRRDDHAGFWKCPYHNGRMCLEVLERF